MNHLRIQILGPLSVCQVGLDGWRELEIKGEASRALLAALVFHKDVPTWEELAPQLWDAQEVNNDRARYKVLMRQAVHRLRKDLGPYGDVLAPRSRRPALIGRKPDEGPQRIYIDWDEFEQYQKDEGHAKALSLVLGKPLPTIDENHDRFGPLVQGIREEVCEAVGISLEKLKRRVPDPLVLDPKLLSEYAKYLPDEWKVSAPPPSPPVSLPIATKQARRPRPPHHFGSFRPDELFEPCHEGEARLERERCEAAKSKAELWWYDGVWLGNFFAYWFKTLRTPCSQIAITYLDDCYDSAWFDPELKVDAPKDKATIIDASSLLSDSDKHQIICAKTNWGFAHSWAKDNAERILAHPSRPSVFGVRGRPVYPGIAGVHTLAQTSDGYVLLALRSPTVDFHRLNWSASFEESLSVGAREFTGSPTGDKTVLDVVEGGLYEEWGIEEDAITDSTCLAIGREWVREPHEHGTYLNLSSTVLTACLLNLSLEEVWASLEASGGIRDRHEHRAWAGCRFATRDDVLRFVAAALGRRENANLLSDLSNHPDINTTIELFPGGRTKDVQDRGLMPTSAARLALASAWFCTLDSIYK
jgi:hypothetical protein